MSSLSDFLRARHDDILAEWDAYALGLNLGLNREALRNDAARLLTFIADDIDTAQSPHEQHEKAQGRGANDRDEKDQAASDHAVHRFREGFDMNQMVSEYRALRATVTQLWLNNEQPPVHVVSDQLVRFNEAIDQLLAESVAQFTREVDTSRELFLATLGHDLRTPLSAIYATAFTWAKNPAAPETDKAQGERVLRAANRMREIIADLLDFTRTQQGSRLPIAPQSCNLGVIVEHTVEELQASKSATIGVELTGNLEGQWDCARIGQLVSNVVTNAVTHGSRDQPVHVSVRGDPATVVLRVRNAGEVIPDRDQRNVFKPLNRGPRSADRDSEGLGLGLYICKQIVEAHHGSIQFESSSERGIEVTVELPRSIAASAG